MARIITSIKSMFSAVEAILQAISDVKADVTRLTHTIDKHFSYCYEYIKCPTERKTNCDVYKLGNANKCWEVVTALCKVDVEHSCRECPFKKSMELKGLVREQ